MWIISSNQYARTAAVYRLHLFHFHAAYFGIIQVASRPVINTKWVPFHEHLQSIGQKYATVITGNRMKSKREGEKMGLEVNVTQKFRDDIDIG